MTSLVSSTTETAPIMAYLHSCQLSDITRKQLYEKLDLPTKERKVVCFAAKVLEIFGGRYAEFIQKNIKDEKLRNKFYQIRTVFTEIQNKAREGIHVYSAAQFPKTAEWMSAYLPTGIDEKDYFDGLKTYSYSSLDQPTRVLCYQDPEWSELTRVEQARLRAFSNLIERLDFPSADDDSKEEVTKGLSSLVPEEELAITSLYFNQVALVWRIDQDKQQPVYFNQLIEQWKTFSKANKDAGESLETLLPLCGRMSKKSDPLPDFLKQGKPGLSFPNYLALCRVNALENNLQLPLSPALREHFRKLFLDSESIALDLLNLTGDLPALYTMPLPERASKPYILALQLFFFIGFKHGSKPENDIPLLEMLVFRSPYRQMGPLEGFEQRKWGEAVAGESPEFTAAFKSLELLHKLVKKDLSCPNGEEVIVVVEEPGLAVQKEPASLYTHPECWPLFYALWQDPKAPIFVMVFNQLEKNPNFTFSLSSMYQFYGKNKETLTEQWAQLFCEEYLKALKTAKEMGVDISHAEQIYFDPPIAIMEQLLILGGTVEKTGQFIELIKPYSFPIDRQFTSLLRHYLLHKKRFVFTLLEDAVAAGVPEKRLFADPHFLETVLFEAHQPIMDGGQPIPAEARKDAINKVGKVQAEFSFSDVELFNLYVEVVRLVVKGEDDKLTRIAEAIDKLKQFCPSLPKKVIYFLFRYHPDMDLAKLIGLVEKRAKWASDEEQLAKPFLDPEVYHGILEAIDQFIKPMGTACPHEIEKVQFEVPFRQSLLSRFFPPLQPLADYFRIKGISEKDGIYWQTETYATHSGQLKFIQEGADLGVHFDWDIIQDRPTLFLSFFNVSKQTTYSAFVPLLVSAAGLKSDNRRRGFYSLLYHLSQVILPEDTAPDHANTEIAHFQKDLDAGHLTAGDAKEMKRFLALVKVLYRNLFLVGMGESPLSEDALQMKVKTAGGDLLFKALSDQDSDLFIETCFNFKIFTVQPNRSLKLQPLNFDLYVTSPVGLKSLFPPISYRVQSAADLKDKNVELIVGQGRDRRAVPIEQEEGSYVTLSVSDDERSFHRRLRYPPEALKDIGLFKQYFRYHLSCLRELYSFSKNL